MGVKDTAEHALLSHDDVFANTVDGLLFAGRGVVSCDALEPAETRTPWTGTQRLRDQQRDVARFWKGGAEVRLALLGVENQTEPERDMVLRVMGYDGASYREQCGSPRPRYPVVTLVLYFGEREWRGPKSLLELLDIPDELTGLVSDYQVRVYDMGRLDGLQMSALKGDIRAVADVLSAVREHRLYRPDSTTLSHPEDTVRVLSAVTGDSVWGDALLGVHDEEEVTMVNVFGDVLAEQQAKGVAQGMAQGKLEGLARSIRACMASLGVDFDRAANILAISDGEIDSVRTLVFAQEKP